MDIKEKMTMCFNDELLNNKILTENEKKVLASLMYSYQICSKSHDNEVIRSIDAIRKDTQMSNNALYDAIRNLDSLYHMIERKAGKSRVYGQPSIGSTFKLNIDAILNPPKERVRFDFSKMKKSSETPIHTVDIDTDIGIDIVTDKDIDISKEVNIDIDKDIITNKEIGEDTNIDKVSGKDVVFENEVNIDSNEGFNYDIYKNRETWHSSLPDEMNQSDYEKEKIIFELYQLHDYYSILNKIEEIENLFKRGCSDKYREKILHILNEKSFEVGYNFSIYLK